MSAQATALAWACPTTMPGQTRLVLLALADMGSGWQNVDNVSDKCHINAADANNAMHFLACREIVKMRKRHTATGGYEFSFGA